jgi:hypothetical protein
MPRESKAVVTALSLLGLALAACQPDSPTVPDVDPQFKKGGTRGSPGAVQYEFVYAQSADNDWLSECWKAPRDPNPGKTFWCNTDEPTFILQVVQIDPDGVETPVSEGTVTFARCERVDGIPVDWTRCGVLQKQLRRYFNGVYYGTDDDLSDGLAEVTLDGWMLADEPVWGMHWEYDKGDGKKPEAAIKWWDLAYEGYMNPPNVPPTE